MTTRYKLEPQLEHFAYMGDILGRSKGPREALNFEPVWFMPPLALPIKGVPNFWRAFRPPLFPPCVGAETEQTRGNRTERLKFWCGVEDMASVQTLLYEVNAYILVW
jgi:hypothetical protein